MVLVAMGMYWRFACCDEFGLSAETEGDRSGECVVCIVCYENEIICFHPLCANTIITADVYCT